MSVTKLNKQLQPDFDAYAKDADTYLSRNIFGGTPVTGEKLAKSARKTYEKQNMVVPLLLALAQGQGESHMGTKGRSAINNPYNVYEYDEGTKKTFPDTQSGIDAYYDLIAKDYLKERDLGQLLKNFVNYRGDRYATDKGYEPYLRQQMPYIEKYINKRQGVA